jgi:hypothetical protein
MTLAVMSMIIIIVSLHSESNDAGPAGYTRLLDYGFRARRVKNIAH